MTCNNTIVTGAHDCNQRLRSDILHTLVTTGEQRSGYTSQVPLDSCDATAPALVVDDLVKAYHGRRVVDGLSFTAPRGAITAVLGPNGAGKTTTIECCESLRTADSGQIAVLGLAPQDRTLRHRVGVMLQDGGLPTGVRAVEMLRHVAAMYPEPVPVDDLVEQLGLESFARTTVRRLSGGQRQRLALATALIGRPELVFLDEPSAGMDPQSRHAVWELISDLRDNGVSFVLTTHLMDEAETLADHVVIVDHGRVIAQGTVPELTHSSGSTDGSAATSTLHWNGPADLPLAELLDQWEKMSMSAVAATGSLSTWSAEELEPGQYRATGPTTPDHLKVLTSWAAARGALLSSIAVNQRSLEDVFLELTGRQLR
ncbi:ABC-2 type transport system ATP-binding protein [Micrococcales bacterium KH10]|nr:ABC-2 type transport system ATP-binding protein [Micrococcales bacterium KH10]